MKVYNLKKYGENGYQWDIKVDGNVYHHRTNAEGSGHWVNENQVSGTCDYKITQKTLSGVRKALNKSLEQA